ncbi:MAG: hypothetical protein FK730_10010 [Asgard group archaeon]|nr:hypothetical protein [Asgard group archaeon]
MNRKKLSMIFILSTILIVTVLYSSKNLIANAALNNDKPENLVFHASSGEVYATKLITHSSTATGNNSYVDETFSINIFVDNIGSVVLTGVNVTGPESDLEAIGYENDWFTIAGGGPNRNLGDIGIGGDASFVYSVTPHRAGTYTFDGSNVTYSNGTHNLYYITNSLTFKVFEEEPSVRLEKILYIEDEETKDGRVKRDREFFLRIRATNYFYEDVNVTIFDNYPGDPLDFDFNDTLLDEDHVLGVISSDASQTFQYNLSALNNGTFIIPECDGNYNFIGNPTKEPITKVNSVNLLVYDPIYEGNDWTKKVPMLSVSKYFQIEDEEGNLINRTELHYTNTTIEEVSIIINITNAGIVDALNILIIEQVYNEWVFITDGVPYVGEAFNLTQSESVVFNYTILPIIVGEFKIEPTEITYEYINQENLLLETDQKLFSNILEIVITSYVPPTDYTVEWWATIGISLGIVAFVAIPLVITIVMYRNRRRIQKGT